MTFAEAQHYLLSLSNLPRREYMKDPKQCQIYLDRLQFFLDILGNPERKIPHYIHVTGTSGKGSVCAFLHNILLAAGKPVGSLTSPHPTYLFERWQLGHSYMSQLEFASLVTNLKPALDEYARKSPYDMISFSELMTAIGLLYLAQKKAQWAVVEVGCGGRYDATNVIPWKDVAVITNIGLDHTEILGDTKKKIAYEKAGIIKKGCLVFTMERNKKVLRVIEKECRKNKTRLSTINYQRPTINANLQALGTHQIHNANLCIAVARSLSIPESAIKKGLRNTHQPLRMEVVSKKPLIILDGAHNPDKMKTTVNTIKSWKKQIDTSLSPRERGRRRAELAQAQDGVWVIHLIVGFSENKDTKNMIKQLATLKPKTIACTRNTINPFRKVAETKTIREQFKRVCRNAKIEIFLDPNDALSWSRKHMKIGDMILVTGSMFLSGELRANFIKK